MKTSSKILIATIAALVLVSPLIYNTAVTTATSFQPESEQLREHMRREIDVRRVHQRRLRIARNFLKDAEPVTIQGTVATYYRNILIIDVDDGRLNILLPRMWSLNSEVCNVSTLFDKGYINTGDEVTIYALQKSYTNEHEVSITVLFAYEIIDSTTGNQMYAVLPFNIDTEVETEG